MLFWVLVLPSATVAAYELHYVNRTQTFTPEDLPPALMSGQYQYTADKRMRTDTVIDRDTTGFVVHLFLTSFCFTGDFLDASGPTANVGDILHSTQNKVNMTNPSTSYWCLSAALEPSIYSITVSGVQWWESVTITFPIPAPEK